MNSHPTTCVSDILTNLAKQADFTIGQKINVCNPLTGLRMPAVITEKRNEPISYDVQIGNKIIRRAHHHIRKAYIPPLHTPPPPKPDMHIYNHAPITPTIYSKPLSAPPLLATLLPSAPLLTTPPPLPKTPPPLPTTPLPLPDTNLPPVTDVIITTRSGRTS